MIRTRVAIAVGLALAAPATQAADKSWLCISNFWQEPTCWSPVGRPAATDNVFLAPVAGNNTTLNVSGASGTATANELRITSQSAATVKINQTGGTLQIGGNEIIGFDGAAAINQSGGTHAVGGNLYVGRGLVGGNGSYVLSGTGALSVAGDVKIASFSDGVIGSFQQLGGQHVVNSRLAVGEWGSGTYTLLGGALSALQVDVGWYNGVGTFIQTGGTNTVSGGFSVGGAGSGSYDLSGGGLLLVRGNDVVGDVGQGTFRQSGGVHIAEDYVLLARRTGSMGTYALSGGTLVTPAILAGEGTAVFDWTRGNLQLTNSGMTLGNGTLFGSTLALGADKNLSVSGNITESTPSELRIDGGTLGVGAGNGSVTLTALKIGSGPGTSGSHLLTDSAKLTATGTAYIGEYGNGMLQQNGGTVSVGSGLFLGYHPGSVGSHFMSGGSLGAGYALVGNYGSATINQSGGVFSVGADLSLGFNATGGGTYALSDGALKVDGSTVIGNAGTGTFTQSGGTHTIGQNLSMGFHPTGIGSYVLSAGTLAVAGTGSIGYSGTGSFLQTGGAHELRTMRIARAASAQGTYMLEGGTLTVGDTRVGDGGSGRFMQTGGTHIATALLVIGDGPGGTGTYVLSGGDLVARQYVSVGLASENNNRFEHSGGTVTVRNAAGSAVLSVGGLGSGPGTGTYVLSGTGVVSADTLIAGDGWKGSFSQLAGSVTAGLLMVGYQPRAIGSYSLTGGAVSTADTIVGQFGTGVFRQNGGTHTVSGDLSLGDFRNSTGTYVLDGGSLATSNTRVGRFLGSGLFTQSGGTHSVAGTLAVASTDGSIGRYELRGGDVVASRIVVNRGGTFDASAGTLQAVSLENSGELNSGTAASLSVSGTLVNTGTLKLGGRLESLAGAISNQGSFTVGSGGTVLGTGSYTQTSGATRVDGTMIQSRIEFTGGTLGGIGSMKATEGPIVIGPGATLLPGNSPGSLTLLGDLNFSGVLGIDLDSAVLWDRLLVTGLLTFGPGYHVEFDLGFGLTEEAYRFDVVHADEGILGFDPSAFSILGSYSGYNAELQNTCAVLSRRCEIDLLLTRIHTDVPEPGTLLLAALGLGMLGSSRRRARKQDIESVAFIRPSTKADPANHPSRAGLARALLPR